MSFEKGDKSGVFGRSFLLEESNLFKFCFLKIRLWDTIVSMKEFSREIVVDDEVKVSWY